MSEGVSYADAAAAPAKIEIEYDGNTYEITKTVSGTNAAYMVMTEQSAPDFENYPVMVQMHPAEENDPINSIIIMTETAGTYPIVITEG